MTLLLSAKAYGTGWSFMIVTAKLLASLYLLVLSFGKRIEVLVYLCTCVCTWIQLPALDNVEWGRLICH